MVEMDRDVRDWLRGLAAPPAATAGRAEPGPLTDAGDEYLTRMASDGTLTAAPVEIGVSAPELVG